MKYCYRCGTQMDDNAQACPRCGCVQGNKPVKDSGNDAICIVGFILSFFAPIAGLIVSIIANSKVKETTNGSGSGFAVAGIIISAVRLAFDALLIICFCIPAVIAIFGAL